jgi:phosphoheptose isomerase
VVLAAATAVAAGVKVLAFTGAMESPLSALASASVRAPASTTPEIQEFHLPIYHALCEALEQRFFPR